MKVSAPTPTLKQLVYSYTAIAEDSPLKDELNLQIVKRIHKYLVDYKKNQFKTVNGVKFPAPRPVSRGFQYYYHLGEGQEVYEKWLSCGEKARPSKIGGKYKVVELDWNAGCMGAEEGYYDIDSIDRFYRWFSTPVTKSEIKAVALRISKEIAQQEGKLKKAQEKIVALTLEMNALLGEGA